ncbi:MAG: hypothetical protein M9894_38855 [Planctomycetes bacterium]|nr:hypothetical protein [Planctomycetota bacterium]
MARPLPTIALDDVRVASPCNASWQAMKGDDRVRFCGSCEKNVYDLSALTRDEAQDLIRGAEGRLCVRFYRRRDGTVLTQDCPVGLRAVRRRLALIGAGLAAGLSVVAAFVGLRREGPGTSPPPRHHHHTMGSIAPLEPTPPPAEPEAVEAVEVPEAVEAPERVMGRLWIPSPDPEPELIMGDMACPEPEDADGSPR